MSAADLAVLKAARPLAGIVARYADGKRRVGGRIFWLCPFHNERTPSFTITPDGGAFLCFGCGAKGDVIEFVMRVEGLDFKAALEFLDDNAIPSSPAKAQSVPDHDNNDLARRIEAARRIWDETLPANGTVVEIYLRSRGLTLPIPPTVRFASNLRHTLTGVRLPAMVSAIQGPDGKVAGIQRTFLRIDGKAKAPFSEPRLNLGRCIGGAVRFAAAGPKLAIGEGIETSLSVMQETGIPTWAAVSAPGMASIILPPCVKEVVLCRDGDEPGQAAAEAAAARFLSESRKVRIAAAPDGKDFNDLVPRVLCHG